MRKVFILACVVLILAAGAVVLKTSTFKGVQIAETSQDVSAWPEDRKKSQQFTDCQETWDILWRWSKKGNLQARGDLARWTIFFWPGQPRIFFPGRSHDEVSSIRDATILAVHSIGAHYTDKNDQRRYESMLETIYDEYLPHVPFGDGFSWCMKEMDTAHCQSIALSQIKKSFKTSLVPKFEDYAAEVDSLIAAGNKPTCIYFRDEDL